MRNRKPTTIIGAILFSTALLGLAACGSGDDSEDVTASADDATSTEDAAVETTVAPTEAAPAESTGTGSGSGSGTLTMDDGTVYELTMSSCETSATDSAALPLSNGYNLTGRTADEAFVFNATRAGFDDEGAVEVAGLEGGFDANGKNASILYANVGALELTIDGANVSGPLAMRQIIPGGPHGAETNATVDVRC